MARAREARLESGRRVLHEREDQVINGFKADTGGKASSSLRWSRLILCSSGASLLFHPREAVTV